MKDGRPSRIIDIRYFGPDRDSYLKGKEDVTAYGRRMAWFLNAEELSLGAYHSLYIRFTSSIEPGTVNVTNEGGDWWQRYVDVGVPDGFPKNQNASELALRGTVAALKSIQPSSCKIIDRADSLVRKHGADLRFLVRSKSYARYILNFATTIPTYPAPSQLYVTVSDKESCNRIELAPISGGIYADAFHDASGLGIRDIEIEVSSGGELSARWSSKLQQLCYGPARKRDDAVEPFYSNLVKRQ